MNKRKLSSGVAALMLVGLIGGSSLALWGDEANITGNTITAGNMDISIGGTAWHDSSIAQGAKINYSGTILSEYQDDRTIQTDTYRAAPGDTITSITPVRLDLIGDNLHVETGLNVNGIYSGDFFDSEYVTIDVLLFNSETGELIAVDNKTQFVTPEYVANHGLPAGAIEYDPSEPYTYHVVTAIHFDASTPDSVLEETEGFIADSSVYVKQLRGGDDNGGETGGGSENGLFDSYDYIVNSTNDAVEFAWPAQPDAESYNVEYNINNGTTQSDNTPVNEYNVTRPSADDVVVIQVQSVGPNNELSEWSEPSEPTFSIHGSYDVETAIVEGANKNDTTWFPNATPEQKSFIVSTNSEDPPEQVYYSIRNDQLANIKAKNNNYYLRYRANGNYETLVQGGFEPIHNQAPVFNTETTLKAYDINGNLIYSETHINQAAIYSRIGYGIRETANVYKVVVSLSAKNVDGEIIGKMQWGATNPYYTP